MRLRLALFFLEGEEWASWGLGLPAVFFFSVGVVGDPKLLVSSAKGQEA